MRRFPLPPLLFVLPFAAGVGVELLWLGDFLPGGETAAGLGVGLVVVGVSLEGWALATLLRSRTSPAPWQPTSTLVTNGPYRLSRNPVYVADTLIYLGVALWLNVLPALLLLPVAVFLVHWLAVLPEERYLATVFGASYRSYQARVRRWL